MDEQSFSARQYEQKYQKGYGLAYPDSHIIRVHRHILEWELNLNSGQIFDFGCGSGAHLKYFSDHGFVPFGCDVSATAIARCQELMPSYSTNFFITSVHPDLTNLVATGQFEIFLSNQVLYYLDDKGIQDIVQQAYGLLKPGGVFIVSFMAYSCWYARYIIGEVGDFKKIEMDTARQKETMFINLKRREDLPSLLYPFKKLHLGSYGDQIREDEGSTDHWLFVGIKN